MARGGVRALADASGAITDNYDFTAFGKLFVQAGATTNAYLYTGQQFDAATGLYSLRARYYDPSLGRFLTQDSLNYSLTDPAGLNRYAYVADDPINGMNPSGLQDFREYSGLVATSVEEAQTLKFIVAPWYLRFFAFLRPFAPLIACAAFCGLPLPFLEPGPSATGEPAPSPQTSPETEPLPATPPAPPQVPSPTPGQPKVYQFEEIGGGFKNGPSASDFDSISLALAEICGTPKSCLAQMFARPATHSDRYRETTVTVLTSLGFLVRPSPPPPAHASVTHPLQTYRDNGAPSWSSSLKAAFRGAFGPAMLVIP
jgi:RHS repeat-associated protein